MDGDPDLRLARLLFQEQRVDVARLQALLARTQAERAAGGAPLWRRLVAEGLLPSVEVDRLRALADDGPPAAAATRQDGDRLDPAGAVAQRLDPAGSPTRRAGAPAQPATLGEYRVLQLLGGGGMGEVFLAEHQRTGVRHALKVMRGVRDPSRAARFRREGAAQARVDGHDHVVRVHHAGEGPDGAPFLVMELCPGGSLQDRLARGPMAPEEVRRLGIALARGLEHCHRHGVLHRDLKPGNVLFDAAGRPKLVDFGLALAEGDQTLTRTGALVGTPAYMAPEQARGGGHQADERTDVYGLGAVLYHALTGQPPFDGAGFAVLAQAISEPPVPPGRRVAGVPPDLEAVVLRALAKAPEERFPTAGALADALEARAAPPAPRRGVVGRLLLAGVLGVGAVVATVALRQRELGREERRRQARLAAADLAAETSGALASAAPLASDAGLPAAWREQARALADTLQGEACPALRQVDLDARALEGLVAVDAGRSDVGAAALHDLAGGAADADDRRLRALRGALVVAGTGDLMEASRDLAAAREAGLRRPELGRWLATARLRRVGEALREGDTKRALHAALALQRALPCSDDVAHLLEGALRRRLARVTDGGGPDELAALRDLLRMAGALRAPPPPDLRAALVDGLGASGRYGLLPLVAAAAPDDPGVQRVVGRFLTQVMVDEERRLETAEAFLPAARRAVELQPDDAEARLELCARLDDVRRHDLVEREVEALLALPGLDDRQRGRALVWRARATAGYPKRARAALADVEAARGLDPTHPLLGFHRALALWGLRAERGRREQALREALAFVEGADPRVPLYTRTMPHAALLAWTIAHDRKAPARALPALEKVVAAHAAEPAWAGWHARLAVARHDAGDEAGARAAVGAAADLMARHATLADLAPRARAAEEAPAAALRAALDELAAGVGRRRAVGSILP